MGYPDVSTTCNSIQLSIVENLSVGKDDGIPLAIQSVHFRFIETFIVPSVVGYVMSMAEECADKSTRTSRMPSEGLVGWLPLFG